MPKGAPVPGEKKSLTNPQGGVRKEEKKILTGRQNTSGFNIHWPKDVTIPRQDE